MKKIQSIFALLLLLVVIFSMNMIFGSKETFISANSGPSTGSIAHELDYKPTTNISNGNMFGNMRYPGKAYLSIANGESNFMYNNSSDDTIFNFGFPRI